MRPVICEIPPKIAAPFTIQYCEKFGIPYGGDPNFGHSKVAWYGAAYKGEIRAVIGFVGIEHGLYVLGYFFDDTPEGKRAFLALNKWTYDLDLPLWGHIREDNHRMWYRMLKEGWRIVGATKSKELLVSWVPEKNVLNLGVKLEKLGC